MIVVSRFRFSVTFVLSRITNCLFLSILLFRFQNKQNQPTSCYYFIKITYNNKCYTQITTMSVADYFTCCNIQVKQHYCIMLATAIGNCAVTNVTHNENNYYVVT